MFCKQKYCLNLSKEEIEANLAAGMPFVIRQNIPAEGTTTFTDANYGDITVDNDELDDAILIEKIHEVYADREKYSEAMNHSGQHEATETILSLIDQAMDPDRSRR